MIRFGENKKSNINYKRRIGVYGLLVYENKLILTEQETRDKTLEIQLGLENFKKMGKRVDKIR